MKTSQSFKSFLFKEHTSGMTHTRIRLLFKAGWIEVGPIFIVTNEVAMVFAPGISPLHRLTPARYLDSHALSSALRDDKTVPSVARQNKVKYQTTRNGKKNILYISLHTTFITNREINTVEISL